ncbi:MAG: type II toxin-antitoxin system RelE/ParE family toxin [Syntrophaceae bacterium]
MSCAVFLTADAAQDLEEIHAYIADNDGPERAGHVLDKIEKAFASLSESPQRGAYTRELLALGIREYREIFFKPYRIIYRVMGKRVYVLLIADGRRDLQTVLQQRLLNG